MLFPQRSIKWTFRAYLHLPAQAIPLEAARPVPRQTEQRVPAGEMYIFRDWDVAQVVDDSSEPLLCIRW